MLIINPFCSFLKTRACFRLMPGANEQTLVGVEHKGTFPTSLSTDIMYGLRGNITNKFYSR